MSRGEELLLTLHMAVNTKGILLKKYIVEQNVVRKLKLVVRYYHS